MGALTYTPNEQNPAKLAGMGGVLNGTQLSIIHSDCTKLAPLAPPTGASKGANATGAAKRPRAAHKWQVTLLRLLDKPAHRFDAERWHDHCLHSTVSTLKHKFGIEIDSEFISVPNFLGEHTAVKRYTVAGNSRIAAHQLLAQTLPAQLIA